MKLKIKNVLALLIVMIAMSVSSVYAQNQNPSNLTSSPYTRYGLGRLGDVGNTSTRSMGDVGVALRSNQYTNLYNPASLTAIDTLTMLFDTAIEGKYFMQNENGSTHSDWDAGFSYFSFHFPLWNHWAGSMALTPYSMVGYQFGSDTKQAIENELVNTDTLRYSNANAGSGGLQHYQISLGWEPIHGKKQRLSLGASIGYITGVVQHNGYMSVTSGQAYSTYVMREYSANGMDLLLGAQYSVRTGADRGLVFGATFAPRTPLRINSEVVKYASTDTIGSGLQKYDISAPMKFGVGVSYSIANKLTVAADYTFENWNKVTGLDTDLKKVDGLYNNINKVAIGLDYMPRPYSNNYFKTCHYRAGFNAKNSYIEVLGSQNTEYTASCGIGMPLRSIVNRMVRGQLNMSLSYTRVQPSKSGLLSENQLCFSLGVTFNEMMFFRNRLR